MKSLADALGVEDPKFPEEPVEDWVEPLNARDFARAILNSPEYRESIHRRIRLDDLAPAVELRWYDYAHGKPVDRVEVKDTTDSLDHMSVAELEQEALMLLETARRLRDEQAETQAVMPEEPTSTDSVH